MYTLKSVTMVIFANCIVAVAGAADVQIPADATGPYDNIAHWLQPVETGRIIYPLCVFAQSADRIFIGVGGTSAPLDANAPRNHASWDPALPDARSDHLLFIVNHAGKVVEEWTQWGDLLKWPHRIKINPYDPEKHVWVVDRARQQVFEFTNDGKRLVMSIGERDVAGNDSKHFGRPTDIAWLPDGTFFVSDGYDNSRVVKFDKDGHYLREWGAKGTGPGQFNLVHGVAIGPHREVYVVDRDNMRIQIFDENGNFIRQWATKGRPTAVIVDKHQNAWVLEGTPGGLLGEHDISGKYVYSWGAAGDFPGAMFAPHDFSVDSKGALYISYSPVNRVDKYVPKKKADESLLVGPPYVDTVGRKSL